MIRGTTAQFKFILPYIANECSSIKIEFWQPNNTNRLLPIIKTQDDCSITDGDKAIYVSLTAEETMRFSDKYKAKTQLHGTANGTKFACREKLITVYPIRDDITEDPIIPPANNEGWIILDGKEVYR